MFALKGRTSTFKVLTVSADGNSADILAIGSGLWETVCMSEKRTKADKGQREADQLEKKSSHRPPQNQGKKAREPRFFTLRLAKSPKRPSTPEAPTTSFPLSPR